MNKKIRTTLFFKAILKIGISWSEALEIGGSWNKDLCVYVQTSINIEFYYKIARCNLSIN